MTAPTTITAPPDTPFVEVVREFDAAPELVYRASTEPGLVARWQAPYGVEMHVEEYDARPGGSYRYLHREADGSEHAFRGVFHTASAPDRLVRTFEFEGWPDQVALETMTLDAVGDRTRMRTLTVFSSVQARDDMIAAGMETGVRDGMDRLAAVVADADGGADGGADAAEPATGGRVVVDISVSLDGYVTAPGVDAEHGLGVDGEVLHRWVLEDDRSPRDQEVLDAAFARTGAVVMGRTLFDFVDGPTGWTDELGYGAERDQGGAPPFFVVTSAAPEKVRLGGSFTFVTDGPAAAVERARAAAGGKDVVVMGGGATCRAVLESGLADVLSLHVAPVVLGGGTPLFGSARPDAPRVHLVPTATVSTPYAHHLTYRVDRRPA